MSLSGSLRSNTCLIQTTRKISLRCCSSSTRSKSFSTVNLKPSNVTTRSTLCPTHQSIQSQLRSYATQVKRSDQFSKLESSDLDTFSSFLSNPSSSILTTLDPPTTSSSNPSYKTVDSSELTSFNNDWMNKYHGKSKLVLKPKNTEELSKILKHCNERNLAVVPQGGNTGLVGGGVPVFDEIVISLALMNNVRSFDDISGTLVTDSGAILEVLDNYVGEKGYMMPLDLGAKGSCHIGGNVATNAGGLRFLRYGSLHGSVLGLEVVLADGTILDNLSTLRKDNTGFDLKQLFIGSEGTIGIITGVSIVTPRRPNATNVAVFALKDFESIQKVFKRVKDHCAEILSAFEFFDSHAFDLISKHGVKDPFSEKFPFYVLIETSGSRGEHDEEKLSTLLEELMESSSITDGVLAQDSNQMGSLWSLRESIPEAAGKLGSVFKYDVSLPVEKMNELVELMRKRLRDEGVYPNEGEENGDKEVLSVVGYGHIGDGNLHINITAKSYDPKIEAIIEPYIYECVAKYNGSISAEHGLGLMKADKIHYSKPQVAIDYMKLIKKTFDPKGILNPYKYIRE